MMQERATNLDLLEKRARVVRAIRAYFDERGFVEVDTPVALSSVAPEPSIEPLVVELRATSGREQRFLQTSPELPMKRLLAAGFSRIFQIAAVFRDGDFSHLHRPEFRLLEWYRRSEGWQSLLGDCEGLLRTCARVAGCERNLRYQGRTVDLGAPFLRLTVDEAFRRFAGFPILDALTPKELRCRMAGAGLSCSDDDSYADLFHRVFLNRIEPALCDQPRPVFISHYPAPLASLARLCPSDRRVSERFELFVAGVELANGFGELTDTDEQRRRFVHDRALRTAAGLRDIPIDERFLNALAHLPPSAGIALGLERLLMLLFNTDEIDAVAFVPWSEA